jgi:hypothetical protein
MKRTLAIAALLVVAPCICRAENMDRDMALGGCLMSIKEGLHDPDSATVGNASDANVLIKGNRAMVMFNVRAKNGFGAMRLMEFMCLLELNNGMLTTAFVGAKGQNSAKARSILKKWDMFTPDKAAPKKP